MYNGVYTAEQFAYMYEPLKKWLDLKTGGGSIGDHLLELGVKRILIYGANDLGQMVLRDVQGAVLVDGFVDKTPERYGGKIGAHVVYGLNQLPKKCDETYILVTPEIYFKDILNDLLAEGVCLEKIISLAMVL